MSSARPSGPHFERHVGAAIQPLPTYRPRRPEQSTLYRVVYQHLETMLAETAEQTEHGFGYPRFIERTFRTFLDCGQLARGFARIRCESCNYERLLPFSCKSRICPSCHARRMHDTAERLVGHLLPAVPYRQWVLTVPRPIRYLMAADRKALAAIYRIYIRTLFTYQRREARKLGLPSVRPGGVTFVQHFGSALNLNIHFHTLLMDGAFIDAPIEQPLTFAELPLIDPTDVENLLLRIGRRILRYAQTRRDEDCDDEDIEQACLIASRSRAVQASQYGRRRDDADQGSSPSQPMYCAAIDGFSLHANVTLRAGDQRGLRRLIRYGARQAFAEQRLSITPDGRVRYRLTRPWGPKQRRELAFEPTEFLHRLAALIPAPYLHLTRYSGIFAPNAHRRWEMTAAGIREAKLRSNEDGSATDVMPTLKPAEPIPRSIPWAELLARTFKVDVLQCPRCDGRLAIIAFITDVLVVKKILAHLKLPTTVPPPAPIARRDQLDLDLEHGGSEAVAGFADRKARYSCRGPPT